MAWADFLAFVTVAVVLTITPGADVAVLTRNTLTGGRRRGWGTAFGVAVACALQGVVAAAGLGALLLAAQPLLRAVSLAGAAYLAFLAVQAAVSAWRGDYAVAATAPGGGAAGFRQGFMSGITNPKVLIFYLAVMPHFLEGSTSGWVTLPFALGHALLSLVYLGGLAFVIDRASSVLNRRGVRRALDAVAATALGAFSVLIVRSQLESQ